MSETRCTQGELNKKDIENIKVLSASHSDDIKDIKCTLHRLEILITTMTAKLDEAIRENQESKHNLHAHLEDYKTRTEDIKKNTLFRQIGVWAFGVIFTVGVGAIAKVLTK